MEKVSALNLGVKIVQTFPLGHPLSSVSYLMENLLLMLKLNDTEHTSWLLLTDVEKIVTLGIYDGYCYLNCKKKY